jgi:hypothetical protein
MTNATSITVTDLTANGWTAQPTGDTLDTGTVAVTLYGTISGKSDRIIVHVYNSSTANLTVSALAGDSPPAFRAGIGTAGTVVGTATADENKWFGPFESARFAQNDSTFGLTFTPAAGTIAATVRAYKLPIV